MCRLKPPANAANASPRRRKLPRPRAGILSPPPGRSAAASAPPARIYAARDRGAARPQETAQSKLSVCCNAGSMPAPFPTLNSPGAHCLETTRWHGRTPRPGTARAGASGRGARLAGRALDGEKIPFGSDRFPLELPAAGPPVALRRARTFSARSPITPAARLPSSLKLPGNIPIASRPRLRLDSGNAGDNQWSLGLSLELPVLDQNQGPIAEAEAKRAKPPQNPELQSQVIGEIDSAVAG